MAERRIKRRRRAVPKPLTDADLDQLAEITPADVQGAKALWDRYASPEFRGLLDAKPIDDDA